MMIEPIVYKLAALSYCGILGAAALVPRILKWKEGLEKLPLMMRRMFLVYAVFIALTVFALGFGTWVFAEEMAAGAKSGVALAGFAFVFWGARILAQFFFFETGPYAKGVLLKIGNTALTVEFVGLVFLYGWTLLLAI